MSSKRDGKKVEKNPLKWIVFDEYEGSSEVFESKEDAMIHIEGVYEDDDHSDRNLRVFCGHEKSVSITNKSVTVIIGD